MNGDFCIKRQGMTIGLFVLALSAGGALAADLGNVTITHDQDVAARTNMQRSPTDTAHSVSPSILTWRSGPTCNASPVM